MSPKGEQNDTSEIDLVPDRDIEDRHDLRVGTFVGPKVEGVNLDRIDVNAGVEEARVIGYDSPIEVMVVNYALNLWRRGEEALAKTVMARDAKVDETSIVRIVAAARAEGERKYEVEQEIARATQEREAAQAAEEQHRQALVDYLAEHPTKVISTEVLDAWQITEENGEALARMLEARHRLGFIFVHKRKWDAKTRTYKDDLDTPRRLEWQDGDAWEHADIGQWIIGNAWEDLHRSGADLIANGWRVVTA